MYSRRGTLLIALSTAAACAILHLNLGSAPCGSSFTRPMPLSWRSSSESRLEHVSRNSFFKGRGGGETGKLHNRKPMLRIRSERDWSQQDDTPVGFGKHKVRTYGDMVHNNPHYCAFIAELDDLRSGQVQLRGFQDYLQGIGFKAPLSFAPDSKSKNACKTFKEVMETQPFYCSWVLSSKAPSLAHFRNYLEDEGFEAPDLKGILPFGRHQGKSYAEVMKTDPEYCMWVKNLPDDGDASDMVRDFQKYLKEQGCEDVLTFGKHKGMRCKDVMAEDPSYCSWVIELKETQTDNAAVLGFKRFLEEHGFSAPAEDVLTLGKYRGKTFKEVMDEDPSYCNWVKRLSKEGTNSSAMTRFGRYLENQGFSVPASAEEVLRVGKHKGKTFEEVMTEQPQFSSWVVSDDSIKGDNLLSFRSFLQDKGFQAPSFPMAQKISRARPESSAAHVVLAGKHKGKTFEEVMKEDPSYCSWVLTTESGPFASFKSFLVANGVAA